MIRWIYLSLSSCHLWVAHMQMEEKGLEAWQAPRLGFPKLPWLAGTYHCHLGRQGGRAAETGKCHPGRAGMKFLSPTHHTHTPLLPTCLPSYEAFTHPFPNF